MTQAKRESDDGAQRAKRLRPLVAGVIDSAVFLTLVMFPILAWMYVRLAKAEEQDALAEFGQEYEEYRRKTPAFIPHIPGGDAPRTRPR